MSRIDWSDKQLEYLINNYKNTSRINMSKHLNMKKASIDSKMRSLNLKRGTVRKYSVNEHYFEKINTEEKAYWLGFLYADGCVLDNKTKLGVSNGKKLKLSLKEEDLEHLKKFNQCISSTYPIKEKIAKIQEKEYKCCEISISNTKFVSFLINQNILPNKTYKTDIPNVDMVLFPHFLRGVIDGDGYIGIIKSEKRTKYSVEIASYNKSILEYIQKSLLEYNINCKIYSKSKDRDDYRLMFVAKEDVYNVLRLTYDKDLEEHMYLKRKFLKAQEVINQICA